MNIYKYMNLPYTHKGRNAFGVDCYGLVYFIYKEERNIILPDFTDIHYSIEWANNGETHITDNVYNKWYEVKFPYLFYDCILFYSSKHKTIVNHIGMSVGDNKFIHICSRKQSEINELTRFWSSKIYKVLRFKEGK